MTAIPAYAMQTCRIPRTTCDELDRKVRRFLWVGTNTERKSHLVARATVTRHSGEGGLGIRALRDLNSAFMAKLGWRLIHEPKSLWVGILRHKYCKGRMEVQAFESRPRPSNAWKGISESKLILQKCLTHYVGDGKQTCFWTHRWVAKRPLVEVVTRPLPMQEQQKMVGDYWESGSGWRWRDFADLILEEVQAQIEADQVYPNTGIRDKPF